MSTTMIEISVTLPSRQSIPDVCPVCGEEFTRTWTGDARPLGEPYRLFEHASNDSRDDHMVPIAPQEVDPW